MNSGREIRFVEEDDGDWSEIDTDQGIASQERRDRKPSKIWTRPSV